jgi:hypothetical protein
LTEHSSPPRSGHWTVVTVRAARLALLGQSESAKLQTGPPAAVVVVARAELVLEVVKVADEEVVTGLIGHVGSLITTLVGPSTLQTEVRVPSRMPACTCWGVMLRPRTWLLPMITDRTLGLPPSSCGTKLSNWFTVQSKPIPRGQP